MKKLFNYLTFSLVLIFSVFIFAGCSNDDEIAKLKQQITEMQQSNDRTNQTLLNKINDLQNKVTEHDNKFIDNEETDNKQNQNIDKLQSFLNGSDTKVYSLGDTVSYSYNGIKYLTITEQIADWSTDALLIFLTINFYNDVVLSDFVGACVFCVEDTKLYMPQSQGTNKNNYQFYRFSSAMPQNSHYYLFLTFMNAPIAIYYI